MTGFLLWDRQGVAETHFHKEAGSLRVEVWLSQQASGLWGSGFQVCDTAVDLRGYYTPYFGFFWLKMQEVAFVALRLFKKQNLILLSPIQTVRKEKFIKHLFLGFWSAIKVQSNIKLDSFKLSGLSQGTLNWILKGDINWNELDLSCWCSPSTPTVISVLFHLEWSHATPQWEHWEAAGCGFLGSYWFCHLLPESHRLWQTLH